VFWSWQVRPSRGRVRHPVRDWAHAPALGLLDLGSLGPAPLRPQASSSRYCGSDQNTPQEANQESNEESCPEVQGHGQSQPAQTEHPDQQRQRGMDRTSLGCGISAQFCERGRFPRLGRIGMAEPLTVDLVAKAKVGVGVHRR
jgi:hypothetical protein